MFVFAEFGSSSRDEIDEYSDRDLLIICPRKFKKIYYDRFVKKGYGVSFFSKEQFQFMKKKGSLFLQHLKFESNILFDLNLEYSRFLDSCDLIKPSSEELLRCQKSIEYLSRWPNSHMLNAWKADFLFCLSRDYLIKLLASCGLVAFGLKDIELKSKSLFPLNSEDFSTLSTLRKAKAAYRSNLPVPLSLAESINNWLAALNKCFDFKNKTIHSDHLSIKGILNHQFSSTYEQLRSLEALYLMARVNGYTHPKHTNIMNLIQKPNFYQSTHQNNEPVIHNYLLEIGSQLSHQKIHQTKTVLRSSFLSVM